jgi:type I restriction enzyme M protein
MLSPKLRSKVYALWTKFWSAGMSNPLTAIEQITYLIFLKQLENLDAEREQAGQPSIYSSRDFGTGKCALPHHEDDGYEDGICHGHPSCKWEAIKEKRDPIHLRDYVFPWLRELDITLQQLNSNTDTIRSATRYMGDAFFQLPVEKGETLSVAIDTIDGLFRDVGSRSANADLMGDIFEYMLEQLNISGQNGQFRTPRHIIRFMIELLSPELGARIFDPAAGTAGFLINCAQYLKRKMTLPDQVLVEWNGAPHRLYVPTSEEMSHDFTGDQFIGYDNDRTMVRIGWMNMILHGIENPKIERRDALSKSLSKAESGQYDYIFANPPYSGNLDKGDIHTDAERFPRHSKRKKEPITTRTELLFVWLILDLLREQEKERAGGRAAVILPEGVLFGSTLAHRALRRELLLEHKLLAVISLPAGIFEPYTGVKSSILFFEKVGKLREDGAPQTEQVWFYEITADGYTLNKKRNEQPEPNDLWDALHKWEMGVDESKTYYQPELHPVRWRLIDQDTIKAFPQLEAKKGQILGINERFPHDMDGQPLPANPTTATEYIIEQQKAALTTLYLDYVGSARANAEEDASLLTRKRKRREAAKKAFTERQRELEKQLKNIREEWLEPEYDKTGGFGRQALARCQEVAQAALAEKMKRWVSAIANEETLSGVGKSDVDEAGTLPSEAQWDAVIRAVVRECAKLDGYNVLLRGDTLHSQAEPLSESKSWVAPVRVWLERDDWESEEGTIKGSHDDAGTLRLEYITAMTDGETGSVNPDALDIDCIEANDYNLSPGRYKPYKLQLTDYDPPAQIIRTIQKLESEIQQQLSILLAMIEGH